MGYHGELALVKPRHLIGIATIAAVIGFLVAGGEAWLVLVIGLVGAAFGTMFVWSTKWAAAIGPTEPRTSSSEDRALGARAILRKGLAACLGAYLVGLILMALIADRFSASAALLLAAPGVFLLAFYAAIPWMAKR
jgi:hypothetical protein